MCSHQANAHELRISNGSLGAYQALWDQGIHCFDVDFMKTRDNFVVATHPQRLQDTIGSAIGDVRLTLKNNTVVMIRSLGAGDEDFPITDVVRLWFLCVLKGVWLDIPVFGDDDRRACVF